ncbi:hypothetical protein LZA78_16080 [Sinirhodobacter sp. WL0062]|uniref:Uncharacterized protein n=1 Tax=Rhodobacter flavimaris TaxID=2907145 RepID=A0ABS8YZA0_9RHOB|nr:hypothetical protein [Sinirhodobacter sp. WL0062]MCE5974998.1 hypothetical protein [Sinirhodobacter sp. WL0062]
MPDKPLETLNFLEQGELIRQTMEDAPDELPALLADLKIGRRKAYYLAAVVRAFEGLPVSREDLLKIGWTKLQIIHTGLNTENWKVRLDMAKDLPVYLLKDYLVTGKVEDPKNCVLLYLTDDEFEVFQEAIGPHMVKGSAREKETALIAALRSIKDTSGSLKLKTPPKTWHK